MELSPSGAGREGRQGRPGISLQTLIIASLASAAASYAVARIWGPGTLLGAGAAPVIVALVSETLRRPVRTAAATAKRVPTVRSAIRHTRSAPAALDRGTAPESPESAARKWRPRWWLAIATGLVAFAIVVGVYTIPDLITGDSITGNGQPTTFFGGSSHPKAQTSPTKTETRTAPTTVTDTTPATVTKTAPTTLTATTTPRANTTPGTTTTTTTPRATVAPPATTPTTAVP